MGKQYDDTSHYEGTLLEAMDSKLDAILEGQASLAEVPRRLDNLERDMFEVKGDLKAIKTAVRDEFKDLKQRVTTIEQASAH